MDAQRNVSAIKKEEDATLTGRELILAYSESDPVSIIKYGRIVEALNSFDRWNESARTSFLQEFFDTYELLDGRFYELVQQFCKLQWHKVPKCIRQSYVNFLASLTIHVHHINTVFACFVQHLLPITASIPNVPRENAGVEPVQAIDDGLQEELYKLSLDAIQYVISRTPLSGSVLLKSCIKQFPQIRQPTPKLIGFTRNLIILAENAKDEEVSMEIWSLIIDRLLQIDASAADLQDEECRLSFCDATGSSSMYLQDPDENIIEPETEKKENPMENKLDQLITLILVYISQRSGGNPQLENLALDGEEFKAILHAFPNIEQSAETNLNGKLFKVLLEAFDEHVLPASYAHSTPFIWFYICSLSKENSLYMLDFLWENLRLPVESPNDWKRAHNAAAFLCGFLARANYVDFELAFSWIGRISAWCQEYVELHEHGAKGKGQHATFYATIQALLFVFCYRHEELSEFEAFKDTFSQGFDKIIYNSLEPLHHISQGVALCFLNLIRHHQLSKSGVAEKPTNHFIAKPPTTGRRGVVELFFPFSFCSLKNSSKFLLPLMRRFAPPPMQFVYQIKTTMANDEEEIVPDSEDEVFDDEEQQYSGGMLIDEGYEEDLMCVQSVNEFTKHLMARQDHHAEDKDETLQDMEA